MGNVLVVIPARLQSSRLYRKMLLPGPDNMPLVCHTAQRAMRLFEAAKATVGRVLDSRFGVVVATDSAEIDAACQQYNVPCVQTSPAHLNGTARVCEVAKRAEFAEVDWFVNWQGDEPDLNVHAVVYTLELAFRLSSTTALFDPSSTVYTPVAVTRSTVELQKPQRVKVSVLHERLDVDDELWAGLSHCPTFGYGEAGKFWRDWSSHHADMSRCVGSDDSAHHIHIGTYVFSREFVLHHRLFSVPEETTSKNLEQEHWMANGVRIWAACGQWPLHQAIDTESDWSAWFLKRWREQGNVANFRV